MVARKIRIRKRVVLLLAVWVILLLVTLSLLSSLEELFSSNPEGRTIVSLSWAGYIISQNLNSQLNVTAISASWTVPQVNASAGDGYSSVWIGIGGQIDKTLIQVGTEQDSSGGEGAYYAWYEMLPDNLISINRLTITPGDTITAAVTLADSNANVWNIQLSDLTTGQNFNLDVNYKSSLASGEWIVERPSINKQISTLCDFGTVPFSNCQITVSNLEGGIGNFSYSRILMTNQQTTTLASASDLSSDGSSFSVSYSAGS